MAGSRRARRRYERARVKRAARTPVLREFSPIVRVLLILGALALLAGGVAMLTAGTAATATRLGRFAGIAIIVALVLGYGAIRGRF